MRALKFVLIICLLPLSVWAKQITTAQIDTIVQEAMAAFSILGVAVGIIQNGEIIHSKGYGTRSLNDDGEVDEHTYFGLASNSKDFTATALAILVDEGEIFWDDRTHEADAFVYFSMNAKNEITGFTMKAISPRTDFSYDFHHVNFSKK